MKQTSILFSKNLIQLHWSLRELKHFNNLSSCVAGAGHGVMLPKRDSVGAIKKTLDATWHAVNTQDTYVIERSDKKFYFCYGQ